MLNFVNWVIVIIAILGAIFNARANIFGYYLWICSNIGLAILNLLAKNYPQMVLFIVYSVIVIYGIYSWKKKKKNTKNSDIVICFFIVLSLSPLKYYRVF